MEKPTRKLKLQTDIRKTLYNNKRYYPILLLKGKWLQDCGFELGGYVKITVREKLLIIEPVTK
jgi:hypothetical protein